jgi:hypothetical protein
MIYLQKTMRIAETTLVEVDLKRIGVSSTNSSSITVKRRDSVTTVIEILVTTESGDSFINSFDLIREMSTRFAFNAEKVLETWEHPDSHLCGVAGPYDVS